MYPAMLVAQVTTAWRCCRRRCEAFDATRTGR